MKRVCDDPATPVSYNVASRHTSSDQHVDHHQFVDPTDRKGLRPAQRIQGEDVPLRNTREEKLRSEPSESVPKESKYPMPSLKLHQSGMNG